MRQIILSAMLLLPAAGAAHAQIAAGATIPCERAFQITWTSQRSERGYFSNQVNLRNIVDQRISVTHSFTGAGAILSQPTLLGRGQSARRELSRTQTHFTQAGLIAATRLACVAQ